MKTALLRLTCFLLLLPAMATAQIPLVYPVENTGSACTPPPLPTIDGLPIVQPLPDPFEFDAPGLGRSTNFADWACRRNEIRRQIENYEIGIKPPRPDTITATYVPEANGGRLTVVVIRNGKALTLSSHVNVPTGGTGPYPAVIGMALAPGAGASSGSVPSSIFTSRNIATIEYVHNQVTTYAAGQQAPKANDPFFILYPELINNGQYSAWIWGVSRLIDGLEIAIQTSVIKPPIDVSHLAVTGCSYAGKMALFSGAFDERIALTIAQESGGGGAPAWRVSHNIEPAGSVEKIDNTDYSWFSTTMRQFSGNNVYKLPHDHHELMAMILPRALLVTGNTDFTWLSNRSCYISAMAAKETYKTFGIGDRMGFYIDGGHGHCAIPQTQYPAIEAFVDKFLLGKSDVNTDTVMIHPYPTLDHQRWYGWWGTGNPTFPPEPEGRKIWLEPECGTVGSNWQIVDDAAASNGKYVTVQAGLNSTSAAPAGDAATIVVPFYIDSAGVYNIKARVNCPSADDDSYWVKVDDGAYVMANGLTTSGWDWVTLTTGNLAVGGHMLTIAYREDGAKLDKLLITTSGSLTTGMGETASNCGAVLPVKLLSFDGALNAGKVHLQWQTTTEENVNHYKIERSVNGQHFVIAGTVAAQGSRSTNRYQYTEAPLAGKIHYYRLKMIDNQGAARYSKTIAVNMANNSGMLQVLPNPVKNMLYATYAPVGAGAVINIVSASGSRVLQQRLQAQSAQASIETTTLAPGVYILQLIENGEVRTTRFLKQ